MNVYIDKSNNVRLAQNIYLKILEKLDCDCIGGNDDSSQEEDTPE